MKLPNFQIGDVVMLQSGGKFMTIVNIDSAAQVATCAMSSDAERDFPFRSLVSLNKKIDVLEPGDTVMCRTSYAYMTVVQFNPQSKTALCMGKEARVFPTFQLIQMHVRYDEDA